MNGRLLADMNASSPQMGSNPRLNRIQKVSKGIGLCIRYGIPLVVLMLLAIPIATRYGVKVPIPHAAPAAAVPSDHGESHSIPLSGSEARDPYMAVSGLVTLAIGLFWFRTLLK